MSKIVPEVPAEGGNTKPPPKQISPAKHWCFTFNNYKKEDIEKLKKVDSSKVPVLVFQEENEGTPHLQGAMSFKTKGRPFSLYLSNKINWRKKSKFSTLEEQRWYCCDPDKRIKDGEVYCRGYKPEKKYIKNIDKFYDWQKDIIDIIKAEPDDRTINWYYEYQGCSGKTTFCKYIYTHFEDVVVVSGKSADMKNCIVNFYEKHKYTPKIILINIPRSISDYVSFSGIEQIKDMFFYSGKYEGGMICGENPHVIIFANTEPEYGKLSMDRWKVTHIC